MKTVFELEAANSDLKGSTIAIIGKQPKYKPYVTITLSNGLSSIHIADKDLERFAVNILKALKSKKLKSK